MLMLREKRSQEWLENTMTLFADDTWSAWVIKSSQEFAQTIADLQLILETLESLHMTINYQKTAILLKLVGKGRSHSTRGHLHEGGCHSSTSSSPWSGVRHPH